ncbi:hypothetical protein [Pseudomonas leptonychotis]|uniref:hypothetical protein n=1 Tax=Pseudomonas leptonychotis TaxID=2448482 RepID=UPI0039F0CCC7
MRLKILAFIVTVTVSLSGGWLYILSSGAAEKYTAVYNGFGVIPPAITTTLFSNLHYWWIIAIIVAAISYLPLFILKNKWKYTSVMLSISCLIALVGVVYAPIVSMGPVV